MITPARALQQLQNQLADLFGQLDRLLGLAGPQHGCMIVVARLSAPHIVLEVRLSLFGCRRGVWEARHDTRPSPPYTTGFGARVARQRCPILRAGTSSLPLKQDVAGQAPRRHPKSDKRSIVKSPEAGDAPPRRWSRVDGHALSQDSVAAYLVNVFSIASIWHL